MSQINVPGRLGLDVYTGILCAAFLVLLTGVILLATANTKHSGTGGQGGSMFKLVN